MTTSDSISADLAYLHHIGDEEREDYPRQPNGKVLLRYPRLFFVVQK
jgi:trans-aconitate methyltransferase